MSAIKDVLLKPQLSLVNCKGQCYDGASNLMGHKTGVAKKIQDLQPKAYPTHCHGHSFSLGVKYTTKNCKLLSDTMETAKEIVSLIKFSPKRENLLGEIKENLEGPESEAKGILGLCPTRWTVRARCFQRIPDNYAALLQEWKISLDGKLQSDDLLEALRSWFFWCQKISQQCVRFASDQAQQGWHLVVAIYVEKLFHMFHIGFPFLLCFIRTRYLPDRGHISDVFSTSSSSSPL